jgi:hypothetical protein
MDDVIKLVDQELASIAAEDWQDRCQHVRNIQQQLMAWEGLLSAGREYVFHVSGYSDDRPDDSSDSSGGDKEVQACGDDIYVDITGCPSKIDLSHVNNVFMYIKVKSI